MNGHITIVIFIGSAIASLLEKETGFLLWISAVICGMRSKKPGFWVAEKRSPGKETGFLHIRSYLWSAKRETRFLGDREAIAYPCQRRITGISA